MDRVIYRQNKGSSEKSKNDIEVPHIFNSWFVQFLLVIVSGVLIYSVYKSVNITSQKLDILRQAEREVEELRLDNLALSIRMEEMSTDEYLEKEARDRLNFGADGEMVFVLPESTMQLARDRVEKILSETDPTPVGVDALKVWVDFIVGGI